MPHKLTASQTATGHQRQLPVVSSLSAWAETAASGLAGSTEQQQALMRLAESALQQVRSAQAGCLWTTQRLCVPWASLFVRIFLLNTMDEQCISGKPFDWMPPSNVAGLTSRLPRIQLEGEVRSSVAAAGALQRLSRALDAACQAVQTGARHLSKHLQESPQPQRQLAAGVDLHLAAVSDVLAALQQSAHTACELGGSAR